ncbi:hypothetical protein LLB_0008 [Legionella longbeachae D-4968]|nr:hypothetical protein LLB_0008 [Legionella longbeachae D-4968]
MEWILGKVEPHQYLLEYPKDEQLLFKIMTIENFYALC